MINQFKNEFKFRCKYFQPVDSAACSTESVERYLKSESSFTLNLHSFCSKILEQ